MSDAPQQGPLRLRPRLSSEPAADATNATPSTATTGADTPPPVPAVPEQSSVQAQDSANKFRLKPKLSPAAGNPEPATAAPNTASPAPAKPVPPSRISNNPDPLIDPPPSAAAAPEATQAPKTPPPLFIDPPAQFERNAAPAPVAPPSPPTPAAVEVPDAITPQQKDILSPGTHPFPPAQGISPAPGAPGASLRQPGAIRPPLPKPPSLANLPRRPGEVTSTAKIPIPKPAVPKPTAPKQINTPPAKHKSFKFGVTLALLLCILLLIGGAGFVWFYFSNDTPPPPVLVRQAVKPAATPQTAETKANEATPTAAQPVTSHETAIGTVPNYRAPIDRTQDYLNNRRNTEQVRVDSILEGREASPSGFGQAQQGTPNTPSTSIRSSSTYQAIAPGISGTVGEVTSSPKASGLFKQYVGDMVIKGVFQGSPSRAIINGRVVNEGEMVDKNNGIIFQGIDPEKKSITFQDKSGATVTRRY